MRPCSLIKSSVPASVPGRLHHDEPGVVGKLVPQCRDVGVQHHFLPHDTTRYYVRILCVYARHAGDAERAPVRLLPGALRRRDVHRAHSSSHALLRLQLRCCPQRVTRRGRCSTPSTSSSRASLSPAWRYLPSLSRRSPERKSRSVRYTPGLPWVWGSPWGSPWVWVWGGYGDRNSVPTAVLIYSRIS